MLKKLILSTAVLSALILNGCGGSDEKKLPQSAIDYMKPFTTVYTFSHVNKEFCDLAMNKLLISTKSKNAGYIDYNTKINCTILQKTSGCSAQDPADFAVANNIQDISIYEDSEWYCAVGLK